MTHALIHLDEIDKEYVTPKYSTAFGELVAGERIEVGRLRFDANEGAVEHAHPQEQVMIVISGRLQVEMEGVRGASWGRARASTPRRTCPTRSPRSRTRSSSAARTCSTASGTRSRRARRDQLERLGKA